MRRPKKDIQLTSYDELLGLEETPEKSMNQVVEIDLAKLYPFKNHPFHVNDDEKMAETVESIKTYGVLTPALVRPRPDGGYEMISGHRRKRGCELCGKTTLPALVRNYTDDEAVIIMVDSNIQRENLLPSEKAHAYKMKYDAMKHQGSKGEKYTADMVGEAAGDSGRTVQRYIRLAALSDALLEYVDNNKIPMIVGEKLSYLKPEEQGWLLEVITNSSIFPTKQQAEQLKECSANGKLNQSYIYAVLLKKESSKINVTIPAKKIGNYFPETYSKEQIEDADLLKGAGFTAYLVSSLTVKEDGSYDFDSAKPVVIGENGATEIFTDEKGYGTIYANKENGKLESNKRMWLYEKIHISILGNRVSVTYSKEV